VPEQGAHVLEVMMLLEHFHGDTVSKIVGLRLIAVIAGRRSSERGLSEQRSRTVSPLRPQDLPLEWPLLSAGAALRRATIS